MTGAFALLVAWLAGAANPVNYSSARAYSEAVLLENMTLHALQKITAQVDKPSASDTLQMKMLVTFAIVDVLIASPRALSDNHLLHHALLLKFFKSAINGSSADFIALLS